MVVAAALGATSQADAAPEISNVSVRGLQIGATTKIVVQGRDLLPDPKLLIDVPIAKMAVADGATETKVELEVTLDEKATPGLYNLRLASGKGVSPAIIVAVDKLPQLPAGAGGDKIAALPTALHGAVTGSNAAKFSFTGKAGQELLAEVEAQRLGSKLRPVLHIYDSQRRQIAWSLPEPWLGGDTRLSAKLPADGEYTLELHDLRYAGAAPGHYRLKVGEFQFADLAFPPVIERGKPATIELVGNVLEHAALKIAAVRDKRVLPAPWPNVALPTGWRPKILVSELPETLESSPHDQPQMLASIPIAVSGRLDAPRQEDVYRFAVTEGEKLQFEVFAARLGSPVDALLEVRNEKGARLATNDDADGSPDAKLDYTVAKGIETIDVVVSDQADRGGEQSIYRLVATRIDDTAKHPGFKLRFAQDTYNVPQGATQLLHVVAERTDYSGPIKLTLDNLPPHVTAENLEIPAGGDATLIVLKAKENQPAASLVTRLHGTSVGVTPPITAEAVWENSPLAGVQPWMDGDVAVALAPACEAPLVIDWSKPPAETPLVLGKTLTLPTKLTRPPGAIGPVKLSLVSSQLVPLVNGRPNANLAVRAERATVDIAVDAKAKAAADALAAVEKAVADGHAALSKAQAELAKEKEPTETKQVAVTNAEKSLTEAQAKRDEAKKTLRTAEAAINNESTFNVIVPPSLDILACDLALKAELRSVDGKTLLAEVYTPVRRLETVNPIGLKLDGESKFEATLDAKTGAAIKLTGTIQRLAGFAGDVTVSLDGQPGGVTPSKQVLKADQSDFEIELKFPANSKPGEVTGLKLFATGPPDPKQANIVVRNEIPVTVNLLAAEPAEKK